MTRLNFDSGITTPVVRLTQTPANDMDAAPKQYADVAGRKLLGSRFSPMRPRTAAPESVAISWGPDPAYASEKSVLWNDARSLGLIDRGAYLQASGLWGLNQPVDTVGSMSPFFIEFFVSGTDVAVQATPPTGNNGEYRCWVDGWEVQGPTLRAFSADTFLRFNWGVSKPARLVRVAFGNFWYRGLFLPGTSAVAPNDADRLRIAVIGDSYIQCNVAGGPGETLVASSGIPQVLAAATGADVFACGLGGSGFSKPAPAPYSDATRMNRLASLPPLDLILVQGGVNDLTSGQTNTQIANGCTALLDAIAAQRPTTPVVVSGIQPVIADAGSVGAATAALKAAALAHPACRGFIDWTASPAFFTGTGNSGSPNNTGNADLFIGTDNLHPSRIGVEHIVTKTVAALAKMPV